MVQEFMLRRTSGIWKQRVSSQDLSGPSDGIEFVCRNLLATQTVTFCAHTEAISVLGLAGSVDYTADNNRMLCNHHCCELVHALPSRSLALCKHSFKKGLKRVEESHKWLHSSFYCIWAGSGNVTW